MKFTLLEIPFVILFLWAISAYAIFKGYQALNPKEEIPTWRVVVALLFILAGIAGLYIGWRAGANAMP